MKFIEQMLIIQAIEQWSDYELAKRVRISPSSLKKIIDNPKRKNILLIKITNFTISYEKSQKQELIKMKFQMINNLKKLNVTRNTVNEVVEVTNNIEKILQNIYKKT